MSAEARTWNEERHGYDVIGPCYACQQMTSYFVDEDGNYRDVKGIEAASAAPEGLDPPSDEGRISRSGWHYPRCWQAWVGAWYPDGVECICALTLPGEER